MVDYDVPAVWHPCWRQRQSWAEASNENWVEGCGVNLWSDHLSLFFILCTAPLAILIPFELFNRAWIASSTPVMYWYTDYEMQKWFWIARSKSLDRQNNIYTACGGVISSSVHAPLNLLLMWRSLVSDLLDMTLLHRTESWFQEFLRSWNSPPCYTFPSLGRRTISAEWGRCVKPWVVCLASCVTWSSHEHEGTWEEGCEYPSIHTYLCLLPCLPYTFVVWSSHEHKKKRAVNIPAYKCILVFYLVCLIHLWCEAHRVRGGLSICVRFWKLYAHCMCSQIDLARKEQAEGCCLGYMNTDLPQVLLPSYNSQSSWHLVKDLNIAWPHWVDICSPKVSGLGIFCTYLAHFPRSKHRFVSQLAEHDPCCPHSML